VLPLRDRGHEVRLVGTHLDSRHHRQREELRGHPKLNVKLPDGVTGYHHEDFARRWQTIPISSCWGSARPA
jgi:glycerol-3-phosphate dehydrogenase (NAD(P)+)